MDNDKTPPVRPRRLWRIVLVASLALNLAVGGIVAGSVVSGRLGKGPPRSFDLGLGPIARALEPQERRAIGRNLRQNRALRDLDLRGRVDEVIALLRAEPFDPQALEALMDQQAAEVAGFQARAQDAMLEQIIAMTPERRRAFATHLTEEMARERQSGPRKSGG